MEPITHCLLTGIKFDKKNIILVGDGLFIEYAFKPIGRAKISLAFGMELINNKQYKNPILAGICRNNFEEGLDAPLLTSEFISTQLKQLVIPKNFQEKCHHLLKYMYNKGGNENKSFTFASLGDFPICYSESYEEFDRILDYLQKNRFIEWYKKDSFSIGFYSYRDVQLTSKAIIELEKELPNIPMIGLANQDITTGNVELDNKINLAKKLFFNEPKTLDNMRSACENLSFILEPLRSQMTNYIFSKDTEDLFNIINNFDIRHNKHQTKKIEHAEQLEWIFYSLLNTINTYTKMVKKFEQ